MKYLLIISFASFCFFAINVSLSIAQVKYDMYERVQYAPRSPIIAQVRRSYPTPTQMSSIQKSSQLYHVDPEVMMNVISCESGFKERIVGDGGKSRGLVQIYAPAHPEISFEEAFDPEFSIDFLAKNLSKGNGKIWTCFRNIYGNLSTLKTS